MRTPDRLPTPIAREGASSDPLTRRQACREMAERLMFEYTGSLPPGQVLATVIRTGRMLNRVDVDMRDWSGMCESMVRRGLALRVADAGLPS